MATTAAQRKLKLRSFGLEVFRRTPKWLKVLAIKLGAPSFTVGVVVVLRREDGAILLVRQRHTGQWALPGGLLQRRETAAFGAARELREEVGIVVDLSDAPPPIAVLRPDTRSIDLAFVRVAGDDVQARRNDPAEVTGFGWFGLDELPDLTIPAALTIEEIERAR